MSEHNASQGQEATVTVRRFTAEQRAARAAAVHRMAARLAPDAEERAGASARLHPDGTVTVTVFAHHASIDENGNPCDINTNVEVEPTKALIEALRGVLTRSARRLVVAAGRDQQEHLSAMRQGIDPDALGDDEEGV